MKTLIESCFRLDTKLLKKDLRHAREHKVGVEGFINISLGNVKTVADYYVEYTPDNDYLVVVYDEEEQRIKLVESELHFGPRSWFECECTRRVGKLYLPPYSKQFKCRHCYRLTYELTTFNKKSKLGKISYQVNRMIKLANTQESIRSMFYAGNQTRRFNRFLDLSDKAGFKNNREDAKELLLMINSF